MGVQGIGRGHSSCGGVSGRANWPGFPTSPMYGVLLIGKGTHCSLYTNADGFSYFSKGRRQGRSIQQKEKLGYGTRGDQ